MKRFFKTIAVIAVILVSFQITANFALAQSVTEQVEAGLGTFTAAEAGIFAGVTKACFEYGQCSICDILIVLINVSNLILTTFAVLALLFFVWGAGYLVFSSGNETKVTQGKAIIKATIIGSVIILVAWQLMAYIVLVLVNSEDPFGGGDFAGNPITTWYDVAGRCAQQQTVTDPSPVAPGSLQEAAERGNFPE